METVHLLIILRVPLWRVRILIHGDPRIRWRAYRVAEYPTPEAVARRCAEGLVRREGDKCHNDHSQSGQGISQCGAYPLRIRWECWGWLEDSLV